MEKKNPYNIKSLKNKSFAYIKALIKPGLDTKSLIVTTGEDGIPVVNTIFLAMEISEKSKIDIGVVMEVMDCEYEILRKCGITQSV